ncbi:hypothetical protein [uncultured Sphingomonas sp.]|uniref:hypothetical protein n=1 Tax=uncultured Sphingomonas sp. TaxID=158754 RepID=UPI0035CA1B18
MTAAYRLKGLGWFAACVAVTLGFYLVSLQVASERKKLEAVDSRIGSARRDIRALETEFDTRANLTQLEKWNGDTLALAAPAAGQFVRSEAQLAAIDVNAAAVPGTAQAVALVVPSAPPAFAPATPIPATVAPVPATVVAHADIAAPRPAVHAATLHDEPIPVAAAAKPKFVASKPVAVAMLDHKLLSDHTLGDILSGARAEAGHRR